MNILFLRGIRRISLKSAWIHITIVLGAFNAIADSAFLLVPLQRTGADRNAAGLLTINLGETNSSLLLQASNLAPGRVYTVTSGGLQRGTFLADSAGRGQLRFSQPSTSGALLFNFDPRERQFSIIENGRSVLQARVSGPGEPRGSIVNEEMSVRRASGTTRGAANARYQLASGTRRFVVSLTNVADGVWTLYADGIRRGNISVSGGSGAITFDNVASTPGRPLNFDPRGWVIDIARGNNLHFSDRFQARANGINVATPSVHTYSIAPVDLTVTGVARARRWIDRDAHREFSIELLDVPAGDYELFANGVFQGFIPVAPTASGNRGEIRFSTDPDDEEEQRLTFNALTNIYSIQIAGQLLFQGQPVLAALQQPPAIMPVRVKLPLFNLGEDADGTARATFKRDERGLRRFAVEVKNVPTGDYYLSLEGYLVGIFKVAKGDNGTRGVIEFEDDPEVGELPLTFDPLGRAVGLERRRQQYFERVFPANP